MPYTVYFTAVPSNLGVCGKASRLDSPRTVKAFLFLSACWLCALFLTSPIPPLSTPLPRKSLPSSYILYSFLLFLLPPSLNRNISTRLSTPRCTSRSPLLCFTTKPTISNIPETINIRKKEKWFFPLYSNKKLNLSCSNLFLIIFRCNLEYP